MRSNSPLVTIITVVYNAVGTLEQTIKSVVNQTYSNIEYIIIDGGSTDGSVKIIENYESSLSYWVSEKDNGIYDAMNKGLKQASGELIALLNSDDFFEPNAVETMVSFAESNESIGVFHGLLRFIAPNGEPKMIRGHYASFLQQGMIEHPTCFIRRAVYEIVGSFDCSYSAAADFDWMQRARLARTHFLFVPVIVSNFRLGGMSDTLTSALEELDIKKKYSLVSRNKYVYKKVYLFIKTFKTRLFK